MKTWLTIGFVMTVFLLTIGQSAEAQPPQNHIWLRQNIDFIYQAKSMAESGAFAYPAWPRLIARAYGVDFRFLMHCNNHLKNAHQPLPMNAIVFIPKRRTLASRFTDCLDIKNVAIRNQILAMMVAASQHRTIPVPEFLGFSLTKSAFGQKKSPNAPQRINDSKESSQISFVDLVSQTIVGRWELTFLSIAFVLVLIYTLVTAGRIIKLILEKRRLAQFEKQYGQDIAEIIENHGYQINELISLSITKKILAIEASPATNIRYSDNGDNGDRGQIANTDIEDRIASAISAAVPIRQRIRFKFRRQRG